MKPRLIETPPKLKIVVAINSLVSTKHSAYSNHIQFMFRLGRNYKHDFILNNPSRMSIDRFRNMSSELAMDVGADYLLFLDDDVLVPFQYENGQALDPLGMLLACDADIASADVCIRGYPFDHMLFRYGKGKDKNNLRSMPRLSEPRSVIDVDAVGCSLTLIKTDLLKQVPKPHFVTGPTTNTEDIYFCLKARKVKPEATIKADTRIKCSHILWEETIGSDNKKYYKQYYEKMFGKPKKVKEEDWRGEEYLKKMKEATA